MLTYISGSQGFLGSHLTSKIGKYSPILHKDIQSTNLDTFDKFFFLSAYGNLATHTDEDKIYQANIEDLLNVILQAKDKPFKSFVYISTSSVRLRIQTTYSRTKKAAEEILLAVMERHNLPICIVRPFSVTGIGEQQEHLIPTLIRSCLKGEKMNFVESPVHDFIDVEDIVDGLINLSDHSARGIYELGTGKGVTNQEVLEMVERIAGKKANINIVPSMRPYDNLEWISNNYKARGYGWLPRKSLEQSITEMVKAYKNEPKES